LFYASLICETCLLSVSEETIKPTLLVGFYSAYAAQFAGLKNKKAAAKLHSLFLNQFCEVIDFGFGGTKKERMLYLFEDSMKIDKIFKQCKAHNIVGINAYGTGVLTLISEFQELPDEATMQPFFSLFKDFIFKSGSHINAGVLNIEAVS